MKNKLKELIDTFDFNLSELKNKILDHKSDNVKLPKDKLKDFISSELHLFIPSKILLDLETLEEEINNNIQFLLSKDITGISNDKLMNTLDKMRIENKNDQVIVLSDKNDNIYRLYIKILPPTAYNYKNVSFVINLTENIVVKQDVIIHDISLLSKGDENIKITILTRSGIFNGIYYIKEGDIIINNDIVNGFNRNEQLNGTEEDINTEFVFYKGVDVIYMDLIDNNIEIKINSSEKENNNE